jgi:isoleucyl-tRNA synthetase
MFVDDNFTASGAIRTQTGTKIGGEILSDIASDRGWIQLRRVRESVLKALEDARNAKLIGGGLEAQVYLTASDSLYALLKRYEAQLRYLFIVSVVSLTEGSGNGTGGVQVEVKRADGQKCERCWNFSTHVGEDRNYPTVCERCSAVLKEIDGA